ncbi:uncharacterized protein LOC144170631 [Haemaphysalis longicornis]
MAHVARGTTELNDVKCVIRALLLVNNGPTAYLSLLRDYRAQVGQAIPYRKFDFSDCLSFLESLTDTVDVSRSGNDVFLSAKVEDNVRHVQTLVKAQKVREHFPLKTSPKPATPVRRSAPQLPEFVENNLLQLIGEGGVQAHLLCDVYSRRFGVSLDVERYGFASLEDCLESLRSQAAAEAGLREGVVAVLEHYPEGVFMSRFAEVYARQHGRAPALATIRLVRRWPELFRVERPHESGDLVLLPATETPRRRISVPPSAALPTESSVRLTHVRSPAEVAVQANKSDALDALTVAMSRFYGPAPSGPFHPTTGRFCAVFCTYWWRRARVAEDCLPGDDLVQVDLLDVGGRQTVNLRHVRPLLPRFAELPVQCVRAALALPPGAVAWKKLAGERLRELTADRTLTCRVVDGEATPACIHLEDEQGQSLAELLASEGLCESVVRRVELSTGTSFDIVRLGTRWYILSEDLSRLLGWPGDLAVQELERRGILFEMLHLQRERDWQAWQAVVLLVGEGVDTVRLFPADNVVDALNVLCYPRKDLTTEVRLRLSKLSVDKP